MSKQNNKLLLFRVSDGGQDAEVDDDNCHCLFIYGKRGGMCVIAIAIIGTWKNSQQHVSLGNCIHFPLISKALGNCAPVIVLILWLKFITFLFSTTYFDFIYAIRLKSPSFQ